MPPHFITYLPSSQIKFPLNLLYFNYFAAYTTAQMKKTTKLTAGKAAMCFAIICCILMATPAMAGKNPYWKSPGADSTKKDTTKYEEFKNLPLKPQRTISFSTTEGTWTSLDVSPDGKTIAFHSEEGELSELREMRNFLPPR